MTPCAIGDVFYADGSCGKVTDYVKDSSPKPVGVVYWVTEDKQHGKVINLKDLGRSSLRAVFDPAKPYDTYKYFRWGFNATDIPDLKDWDWDCDYLTVAATGDHNDAFWSGGQYYTEIISTYLKDDLQYAAPAAKAFYPPEVSKDDPKFGQGNWYLPTLGELMDLYGYNYQSLASSCTGTTGANGNTKTAVNATLTTLKSKGVTAETLTKGSYYSSSEHSGEYSWLLVMDDGYRAYDYKDYDASVRASLEF